MRAASANAIAIAVALPALIALSSAGCQKQATPADPETPASGAPAGGRADGYCRRSGDYSETPAQAAASRSGSATTAALPPVESDPLRPMHTFSIVARDPKTGDLGVAVQSHWFAVGSNVSWAEPGVGAVATQSFIDPAYGPRGLELMRAGKPAGDALAELVAADEGRDVRQVAFVDTTGRVAAHTGPRCIQSAGHHVGPGYSVQANLMGNDKVVPAMAAAYESGEGDLADRLMAALDAAQKAGGDIRGCQSAAILVVRGKRSDKPWADKIFDLRIDDSPDPIGELRRLVRLARAYDHMNRGDAAVEKGDMKAALHHYGTAADMTGGDIEMLYWQAVALAAHGDVERSIPLFRRAFEADPRWIELTRRLHEPGILPDTAEARAMVERIIREAAPAR